jgi:hypothetical protein
MAATAESLVQKDSLFWSEVYSDLEGSLYRHIPILS